MSVSRKQNTKRTQTFLFKFRRVTIRGRTTLREALRGSLPLSEDFSLLLAFSLVTFSWLFRGFFVALFCLERQCLGLFRGFSWLFRFGQDLRVLALEQSSDSQRVLRGLCAGLFKSSAGSPRGSAGFRGIFRVLGNEN